MRAPGPATRWLIAVMGTVLQLCLGTVYAWSYFQKLLVDEFGWVNTQVTWTFSLTICFLGIAAAWGGVNLPKYGPRKLAVLGGVLFGLGYLLAAVALRMRSLPLLYLGHGVVGGIGLGLGYVTPVATVAKWFPDKKGLVTGMVIMGFGFGALLMSKLIAPTLRGWSGGDLAVVFAWAGVGFIVVTVPVAMFLRDPPDVPIARTAATSIPSLNLSGMFEPSSLDDLLSPRFALMWLVFFCNILAGISIISFQSPILQDLWRARDASLGPDQLASYGATLIAASSLFNGLGRFFWGALSDRIGRTAAFRWMLASQALVFALLTQVRNPWLFSALICHVLLCYGGGFGTMPSFVLDVFGKRKMATLYGAILTAWSAAGVAGPQLIAVLKDRYETDASMYAFLASAAVVGVGFLMSLAFPRPLPAVALAASESVGSGGSP